MKQQITELLKDIFNEMGVQDVEPVVDVPEDPAHGEYTTNVAMRLTKTLKKPPMEIALSVKEAIMNQQSAISQKSPHHNIYQKDQKASVKEALSEILQAIDRVEVVPPGFINFFLTEAKLSSELVELLKEKEVYGTGHLKNTYRVTVEFTDPNPFKEFHIGHLYSNSVGEAISRLLESQGHVVRRVNYQGDVGMHVAKVLYGLFLYEDCDTEMEKVGKGSLTGKAQFLGKAYAAGARAFEEDEKAAEEMKKLNKFGFIAAQRMWQQEKGVRLVVNYRGNEDIDEDKLARVAKIYEMGRAWSLAYFETIYARLGTTFSGYYFESAVGQRGIQIVRDHINDGVFEESEGAIVYRGEKKGLHTRVFVNQLGLPTYEAKELGLAPTKYDDWPYDRSLIITGNEINEYFKVLLSALGEVSPSLALKTRHIGHGMVKKSDGSKMSSRSGDVLTGEGLLDEVKESIYTLLDKNKSNYTKKERGEIAEKAAVAAVKYSLLRVSLPSDVAFDPEKSVSFDGDSGPYLQYTYARCKSVLRKAKKQKSKKAESFPLTLDASRFTLNPEERSVARLILYFPDVVSDAAKNYAPNTLCTYLFKLAASYNLFYAKHVILPSSFRLSLTAATSQVLKNGLYLLGIETLEQM